MRRALAILSVFLLQLLGASFSAEPKEDIALVNYHVWYSPNPNDNSVGNEVLTVQVAPKSLFTQVMDAAADQKPEKYGYDYVQYPFGKYITAIGKVYEEPESSIYWWIYQINGTAPNPSNPPTSESLTPVGVDYLSVEHGDTYLFWRTNSTH